MILGKDHHIQPAACLNCKAVNNGATCIGHDVAPQPGNIVICIECGHIMAYDNNMQMRKLTDKEMIDIAGDPRILLIQKARKRLHQN